MMAAVEFTGHHISPVGVLAVAAGRILQQSPVVGMALNDIFPECVQFIQPI